MINKKAFIISLTKLLLKRKRAENKVLKLNKSDDEIKLECFHYMLKFNYDNHLEISDYMKIERHDAMKMLMSHKGDKDFSSIECDPNKYSILPRTEEERELEMRKDIAYRLLVFNCLSNKVANEEIANALMIDTLTFEKIFADFNRYKEYYCYLYKKGYSRLMIKDRIVRYIQTEKEFKTNSYFIDAKYKDIADYKDLEVEEVKLIKRISRKEEKN